jgi:hypothetical protein
MTRLAAATVLFAGVCALPAFADAPSTLSCAGSDGVAELALCMARAMGFVAPVEGPSAESSDAESPPAMCRDRHVPDSELLGPVPIS